MLTYSVFFVLLLFLSVNPTINTSAFADELTQQSSPNGEKLLQRRERDADAEHNVKLKVNHLNDTHQQLIVHWVGEGSSIIICLARDSKETVRKMKISSSVYYSYDYGDTFESKTDLFKVHNGTLVLDKFYIHSKFPARTIFTDSTNKMIFLTDDHGKTFRSQVLNFVPSDVSIAQSSPQIFLVHDKNDASKKLYITHDFGFTWGMIQDYVRSFEWFSEDGSDRKYLIVQREEPNGATVVLKLKSPNMSFSKFDIEVLMTSVSELSVKGDYIFIVQNSTNQSQSQNQNRSLSQSKDFYIKYKSSRFMKTIFNTELPCKDFHVADITENRILVAVHHTDTLSNLYMSDMISEKETEVHFDLSMENIFCFFPNGTWRSSLVSTAETPFADLHKVEGMRGIYIASQVMSNHSLMNASLIAPEYLVTRISFNWGASWRPLNLSGQPVRDHFCLSKDDCSLHLSQKFNLWYPTTRQMPILSSKSAPGLIIANGVFGKSMKGHPSIFMSRDAGVTWKQVLKDNAYFNIGDHGGIIVAIKYNQKPKEDVSSILYSTDMGESWIQSKIMDSPLRVYSLMTEPGENTTIFSLFGSPPGPTHHWLIVKADFQKVFNYTCTKDDFKTWVPYNPDEKKMNCVLGRREVYKRRQINSTCYIGVNFDQPYQADVCPCDREDFVCDEGFYWDMHTEHCIRNKSLPFDPYAVPKNCPPYTYFRRTKGYKKITGDVCVGGPREFQYDMIPCPIEERREFLLLAQKDRIVRFKLDDPKPEVLPLPGLQNVIAVEYDVRNKCVFYADIVTDVISKWCLDSAALPKNIVDSRLHSVEGMAYDWISRLLYFVDGVRAKIEAVRVDVDNSNRYRRTIINSTIAKKPRGITVHPVAGYMFWTDWMTGAPGIHRANLDGSNPIILFSKPTVEWPNGITVDYIADRIYWVDAREDYIASSDFYGKGFKKIVEHDSKVSHPFSVAVFKDNMYWDDWRANAIYVAEKDYGLSTEVVAGGLPGLMDLKIYAHSIQEGSSECSNSTCSHMCFTLPENKSICGCPDDLMLAADGLKCVCPGGQEPQKNGGCAGVNDTCGPLHFRCSNGMCVPNTVKCDGEDDCGDKSDEIQGCGNVTSTCEPGSFRCDNGKCILGNWRCDHDFDCPDQSDEKNCEYPSCKSNQFACDNGRCIAAKWRCDLENDCRDGSDERNCSTTAASTCASDEFNCSGKSVQCIPMSWLCDNEPDCPDSRDEFNCTNNKCGEDKFLCANKKCIHKTWRCDGEDDCGDNSDEVNCTAIVDMSTELPPPLRPIFACGEMTFRCLDGQNCVPIAWKCDRVADCLDGSDEFGCPADVIGEPKFKQNMSLSFPCGVNEFTCFTGHCIPQSWVCDRQKDCSEGEDEKLCDGVVACKTDGSEFRCRKNGQCLPAQLLCNGIKECPDGSDEGICDRPMLPSLTACPTGYFRCSQVRCEPLHKKCDNKTDCLDLSDEDNCIGLQNRTYQATQLIVEKTFDGGVLFTWTVKPTPPPQTTLEYLPSIALKNSTLWMNVTSWTKYNYYRFDNLTSYTTYNVTVYVNDTKLNKVYPPAYYLKLTSGKGIPSPPRDVKAKILSSTPLTTTIEVSWSPPVKPNGEIMGYSVYIEPPYGSTPWTVGAKLRKTILNYSLEDNVEYRITVTARNELFESAPSNEYSFTFENKGLRKVADLRADRPTENSLTLSWKAQKPNLNYTINVFVSSAYSRYLNIQSITTRDVEYAVTGLSPGVEYTFEVIANNSGRISEGSRVRGTTLGDPLPTISNLTARLEGFNMFVSWSAPKEDKFKWKYAVYYDTNITSLLRAPKKRTETTSATVYDLSSCTSYIVDVGVIRQDSLGPLSGNMVQVMTGIDPKAPPTNVRISPDSSIEPNITITWNSSCPQVTQPISYVVNIVETNTKEGSDFIVANSTEKSLSHTIGLKFGGHYNISVATTEQHEKKWLVFATDLIPAPIRFHVISLKNGEFMLDWSVKSDRSLKDGRYLFEILVCEGNTIDERKAKIYTSSIPALRIEDLRPGQQYAFAVRIVTHDRRRSNLSSVFVENILRQAAEAPAKEGTGGGFTWLFIICVMLVGGAAGFLYWKRKRSHINSFKNLANSHYNTRSGSTTFSGVNGLDLDDTPEIREHFSDDEPLVIA